MDLPTNVFVVQHLNIINEDEEDVKFIGVYSTEDAALQAVERLKSKPGFCDRPEGFHVDSYVLDEDYWQDGYMTVWPQAVPNGDSNEE